MKLTQFITNHPCRGLSILCYCADNKKVNKKCFKKSLITSWPSFHHYFSGRKHKFCEITRGNRRGLLVLFLVLKHPHFWYCAS